MTQQHVSLREKANAIERSTLSCKQGGPAAGHGIYNGLELNWALHLLSLLFHQIFFEPVCDSLCTEVCERALSLGGLETQRKVLSPQVGSGLMAPDTLSVEMLDFTHFTSLLFLGRIL